MADKNKTYRDNITGKPVDIENAIDAFQELNKSLKKDSFDSVSFLQKLIQSSSVTPNTADSTDLCIKQFDKMGVTVTDTDGKLRSTYEVLLDMAEFYKTAENKTQALAIATTLLGRSGAELIPLLQLGKDGIKALGDSAQELGIVLNSEAAAAMKEFDDELTTAKTGLKGIASQITIALLPALKEITQTIIKDIKAFVSFSEKLKENKKALEDIKNAFITGYKEAVNFITTLIVGAGQVVDAGGTAAVAATG